MTLKEWLLSPDRCQFSPVIQKLKQEEFERLMKKRGIIIV